MKRNQLTAAGIAAALCIAGVSTSARGVLIDVDFNGSDMDAGATQSGAAATGNSGDIWNGIGGGVGTGIALNNSLGTSSGATLDFTSYMNAGGADVGDGSTFSTSSPVYPLMRDLIITAGLNDVGTVNLHNVPAGTYDLYLYSNSNINSNFAQVETRVTTFSANGVPATVGPDNYPYAGSNQDPNSPPGTQNHDVLTLGKNYTVIPVVVTRNGELAITYTNLQTDINVSDTIGQFNGFQLQSIPEPTSMGLLCFGATGVLAVRRRRTLSF